MSDLVISFPAVLSCLEHCTPEQRAALAKIVGQYAEEKITALTAFDRNREAHFNARESYCVRREMEVSKREDAATQREKNIVAREEYLARLVYENETKARIYADKPLPFVMQKGDVFLRDETPPPPVEKRPRGRPRKTPAEGEAPAPDPFA